MKRKNKGLTKEQVLHVAGLANLTLTDEEIGVYTKQLSEILGYVEKLQKVDTSKVEPTYQTIDGATNGWREDEVRGSLSQEEALSAAERKHEGYFVTESVFGETKELAPAVRSPLPWSTSTRRGVATAGFGRTSEFFQGKNSGPSEKDKYNAVLTEVNDGIATAAEGGLAMTGKTIGHKDLFLTKGVETTAGSKVLEGYIPQYSGTVVERLEKAGYKSKYKFNCDAWGHGSSGENSDFGATKNPWNEEFTPGGSSSGSAAAVAAGSVDFATGTDTGGSIRLPASFCGVTGLKPTYGAVSRYGIVAMSSSLDSPGVIGRSVKEVEKIFRVMAGEDERDATNSLKRPGLRLQRPGLGELGEQLGIRIGIPREYLAEGVDGEVKRAVMEAVRILEKSGMKAKEVSLPNSKYGIAAYYLIQTTEVASNLGRYDGIRYGQDRTYFGAEAKRRIMLGTFASSAGYSAKFYEKAARVRTLVIQDFDKVFKEIDLLLAPVSATLPFKLGEKTDNPLQMYLSDVLTVTINLAGLPGLALPCGFSGGGRAVQLPIGMQIIGSRWSEETLFEIGKKYQELTDWHQRKPDKYYKSYKDYKNGD